MRYNGKFYLENLEGYQNAICELICMEARGAINILTRLIDDLNSGKTLKASAEVKGASNAMDSIKTYMQIIKDIRNEKRERNKLTD